MTNEQIKSAIETVTREVMDYRDFLDTFAPSDIEDEYGNPSGDIRLQSHDGELRVWTGDAGYDTDHRGEWGASSVLQGMTDEQCREIAEDLVSQVEESVACS